VALPLPLRNRLAELILGALSDPVAREGLAALARVCDDARAPEPEGGMPEAFPADLFEARGTERQLRSGFAAHAEEFRSRVRRGWEVVRARPLAPAEAALEHTLAEAGALFDAGLYFEVHEHLEPRWFRASGDEREILRGLIQVAVGFQHLANDNVAGAKLLLAEGAARLAGREIAGVEVDSLARAAGECSRMLQASGMASARQFDWTAVPCFPRRRQA
jgi:hypothetical protein